MMGRSISIVGIQYFSLIYSSKEEKLFASSSSILSKSIGNKIHYRVEKLDKEERRN